MSIDWSSTKRKAFRLALQRRYPGYEELEMFVDEEIDLNLADVVGDKPLPIAIRRLFKWALANGNKMNELFEAFCNEHLDDPVISQIKTPDLISAQRTKKKVIDEKEWDSLFDCFIEDDFSDVKRAFKTTTRATINSQFKGVELFSVRLDSVLDVREELERLDSYKIAVQFTAEAILEISRSTSAEGRDLANLIDWRDRTAKQHGINTDKIAKVAPIKTGYLLVSVKSTGQSRNGVKEVMLFPELHADVVSAGEADSFQETLNVIACESTAIGWHLSQLIYKAEEALNCEAVTLELFLAWPQIEEHTDDWDMVDLDGNLAKLKYRRYILRSLDRFEKWEQHEAIKTRLENNWKQLKRHMESDRTADGCFHSQKDCPEPGQLSALLSQKAGLKLISQLPEDYHHRKAIFGNIVESAVPVAVWIDNANDDGAESILAAMNSLLQGIRLTHFGTVAESLMQRRAQSDGQSDRISCQLRSLFDCPERWPQSLPTTDPLYEEASLVVPPL